MTQHEPMGYYPHDEKILLAKVFWPGIDLPSGIWVRQNEVRIDWNLTLGTPDSGRARFEARLLRNGHRTFQIKHANTLSVTTLRGGSEFLEQIHWPEAQEEWRIEFQKYRSEGYETIIDIDRRCYTTYGAYSTRLIQEIKAQANA